MNRVQYVAERQYAMLQRRGTTVTVRKVSVVAGSIPSPNPPRIEGSLTLSGAHTVGASALNVAASTLAGTIKAGDSLKVGAVTYKVTGDATSTVNTATVTITPNLASSQSDGTVVTPTWKADTKVPAAITNYNRRLVDGNLIQASDFQVSISSYQLDSIPTVSDLLIMPWGELRKIMTIVPQLVQGETVGYVLQAR